MVSSADVAILMNVAELARKCGLRPSEADAFVYLQDEPDQSGHQHFVLDFGGIPTNQETYIKWKKLHNLLGMEEGSSKLSKMELRDIEDSVDRALSLAPRTRSI